ncbi:MAG: hypothetical protein IPP61_18950 [Cytophagaceae bacterium]|nr:hypothetical protein [Cytophagaceae bacterium]MBL0300278.1 hypothetical protein [Cytophagaceae bacterium]MBL0327207.1 hypothetical protein [Cytophagaceae bacterium]
MKTIVLYFSHNGSNKYLAQRIAKDFDCPIEEIIPKINSHLLMLMGINFGNKPIKSKLEDYDRVILCGPIFMGKFIVPLKNFVKSNLDKIKSLVFVTCCGSTFEKKDEKFGYNLVFNEVKNISGQKCSHCEAFPIILVLPDELKNDGKTFMKTRLTDDNFKGEIKEIYDSFIEKMKA